MEDSNHGSDRDEQDQHDQDDEMAQQHQLVPKHDKRRSQGKVLPFDLALWNAPSTKRALYESVGIIKQNNPFTVTSHRRDPESGHRKTKTKERQRKRTNQSGTTLHGKRHCNDQVLYQDNTGPHTSSTVADSASAESTCFQETESVIQLNMLKLKLDELKVKEKTKTRRSWASRMEYQEENWQETRPQILLSMIACNTPPDNQSCLLCGDPASIRCNDCDNSSNFICDNCDIKTHSYQPFHRREHWVNGFFEAAPNDATIHIDENGEYSLRGFDQFFPIDVNGYDCCKQCHGSSFQVVPSDATYIAVTLKGRFVVKKQQIKCAEPGCHSIASYEVQNLIRCGFWPGSITRIKYVFSIELLEWISALMKHMPGTSISAFAKAIQHIGQHEDIINKTVLSRVLNEYQYCKREILLKQEFDSMKCPPCSIYQHSAHVDGNFKVYRYSKVPRGLRKALHSGTFIVNDDEVENHFKNVYDEGEKEVSDNTCGGTVWRAAKARAGARANQDQTGLEVGGCRHALAQKACNMYSGEQYGYPHFLHIFFLLPLGVKFLWQDVICRYWPWAKRKVMFREAVDKVKPALSIMHSKAHSWDCQGEEAAHRL